MNCQEIEAAMLLSLHNIAVTEKFMEDMRESIINNNFAEFKRNTEKAWYNN